MISLDERLFALLNGVWTSPLLDWWAAIVRARELWILPALVALVLAWWLGGTRARRTALLLVLVFVAGDGIVVRASKLAFQRPRPEEIMVVRSVRLARVEPRVIALALPLHVEQHAPHPVVRSGRSFPSGHAWNAFAVATVFALAYRRWGWLAFLPALAIAHARVYTGQHWPSDVVLSGLLSIPATWGLALLLDFAWRCVQPRLASRWRWARAAPTLIPWRVPEAPCRAGEQPSS